MHSPDNRAPATGPSPTVARRRWNGRFSLGTLLAITAAVGMAIQLAWQVPEVWPDPYALIAATGMLGLGIIVGRVISHSAATRVGLGVAAVLFFLFLGYQWAHSFRDDYLIWSMRWMCLGFLAAVAWKPAFENARDGAETDDHASTV